MLERYSHYFNIDEDYFPQVNEEVINQEPDYWKKFYPHTTFEKLVRDTVSVLTRRQKVSVWVEGAYGTGKSHAVLTLKKLLEASTDEIGDYFRKYNLDKDLCNQLQNVKSQGKDILTVHRYGSSEIRSDNNLILAIQESIKKAIDERGIAYKGENALKEAVIEWLSDEVNKDYFGTLVTDIYRDLFGGDTVEEIIINLNNFQDLSLNKLMNKIFKVAEERGITALSLNVDGLVAWIKDVIKQNDLKAIVFMWDEFTEYFDNNIRALTGFQKIAEISATNPFYFIIVTHKSAALFDDKDKDKNKILDRFIKPTCIIELPENMAFQLMGAAMEKNDDQQVSDEWDKVVGEIYDRTKDSRKLVKTNARITDDELKNIIPIHPYTAMLLKYISVAFDSNQRSMFDFIKNDRGDEIRGFQWYINNFGPEDDNPLLTVDMLWDFFYEKGKGQLSHDIRTILDCYPRASSRKLDDDEKRVLKATLLLQAISQRVGDAVELFIPNEKNINNAFEGSDLESGAASRIAEKLVRDEVLYKRNYGNGKIQYSALVNTGDTAAIEEIKEEIRKKVTSTIVYEGNVGEAISMNGALSLRYELREAAIDNFTNTVNMLRNQERSYANKILAVVTFAKDDAESAALNKLIQEKISDPSFDMIFIDTSGTPLGRDAYNHYEENMANSIYQRRKDNGQADQFEKNAKESLKKWKNRISSGEFILYSKEKKDGERITTIEALMTELSRINRSIYYCGIESEYNVIENMYNANSLKLGVECGVTERVTGTYKSGNPMTKLEKQLEGAWGVQDYWIERPNLLISKIKKDVDDLIKKDFDDEGRISISKIYSILQSAPYGFMPCNFSAFILGFLLKEYANEAYNWSDGLTSDTMNVAKLKEMVEEIIKLQTTNNARYKDKYIVAMTPEERAFTEVTSVSFDIPSNLCTSIEQTRDRIRNRMKELSFPVWCLKYILEDVELKCDKELVAVVIDKYCGIANSNNIGAKTDVDIALSIGELCISNPSLAEDLKKILTKEQCMHGMQKYLKNFENGSLISLASQVGDNGQYVNALKRKFDADAANWVWNVDTANRKIREVIIEYKIIIESNKILAKSTAFENTIHDWCEKCRYIRISYAAAENYLDEIRPFLKMLIDVKRSGELLDSQKELFLELLTRNVENFKRFYSNQVGIFKRICEHYVEPFSDDELADFFKTIPLDMFIKDRGDYNNIIGVKVEEFKASLGKEKLRALWRKKTGTTTPREWSLKYSMPILSMVAEEDFSVAQGAFRTINSNHPEANEIKKAFEFLSNAEFWDKIVSENARDEAFKKNIIKSYDTMLTDINEVKEYLLQRVYSAEPYDWFGNLEVDRRLKQKAEAKYYAGGSKEALQIVDQMEISEVKHYLKELIKDNMIVGMEIIKGK